MSHAEREQVLRGRGDGLRSALDARELARYAAHYGNPYATVVERILDAAIHSPMGEVVADCSWLAGLVEFELDKAARWAAIVAEKQAAEAALEAEALTVKCPYCGVEPGSVCRSTSGTRVVHHANRWRVARGLAVAPKNVKVEWPVGMPDDLRSKPSDPERLAELEAEARGVGCPFCKVEAGAHCTSKVGSPTSYHLWRIREARGVRPLGT